MSIKFSFINTTPEMYEYILNLWKQIADDEKRLRKWSAEPDKNKSILKDTRTRIQAARDMSERLERTLKVFKKEGR